MSGCLLFLYAGSVAQGSPHLMKNTTSPDGMKDSEVAGGGFAPELRALVQSCSSTVQVMCRVEELRHAPSVTAMLLSGLRLVFQHWGISTASSRRGQE